MIEEPKKIIINNYYFIYQEDSLKFKEFLSKSQVNIFQKWGQNIPINNNILIMKKTENFENGNEINKNGNEVDGINFGINKEVYKNDIKEKMKIENTSDMTIEIKTEKKIECPGKKFLFSINKEKKVGRKPKSSISASVHTKFSIDNILRKIKVKIFRKIINYLNSIILSKYRSKIKLLKPLMGKISQINTINFNKELLHTKLKDIFSLFEINGKFKCFDKNYNKEVIDKIYAENIKELIDILEMNFLEIFCEFRNLKESEKLKGFEKIDSVIREMSLKEEEKDKEKYISIFKKVVMDFENYYFNRIPRKQAKN